MMIDVTVTENGIAILTWSDATPYRTEPLATIADRIEAARADGAEGIVLAGGSDAFLPTLDIAWLSDLADRDPGAVAVEARRITALLHRIETLDVPVAAALCTDATGPGLDLALACHHRIAVARTALGFPDIRYGLPPIGGGALRLAQRVGAERARALLASDRPIKAAAAQEMGLVGEAATREDALDAACRWAVTAAAARRQSPGLHAVDAMLKLVSGAPDEAAYARCADTFAEAATAPATRALMRTLGVFVPRANDLARRPAGVPTRAIRRIGVLGAGLMGGGIALTAARSGIEVVLLDVDRPAAERGLARLSRQEEALVDKGQADAETVRATLARITPTDSYGDLADAEIVVEAVFEDRKVKAEATRRAAAAMRHDAIFATNTSTLPISELAEAFPRPAQFIGCHFFSPVPRMPLLEIICGAQTAPETLAVAMDFAKAIGKTPIVVNDSRGFYTTRVVMAYQAEAFDMLAEGIDPALIEDGGRLSGMPMPPLALSDAVGLDLIVQIQRQAAEDLGEAYQWTPGYRLVAEMVDAHGRLGKKSGGGFFDYDEAGRRVGSWTGLADLVSRSTVSSARDVSDRLLAAQSLEAFRCLDEGVITDPSEVDVGALLGWSFAPWTGGPCSYIDTIGAAGFVARCNHLSERYGNPRLTPPARLREIASRQGSVFSAFSRSAEPVGA